MDKRLVMVEWLDAACNASWQDDGAILPTVKVWTAGFLTHEEEAFVMISGSVSEDGGFNQTMSIPRGMLVSMKDVG
jgi:hypothetical protein